MSLAIGMGLRGLAASFDQRNLIVVNRTGADTVVGTIYRLDITGNDGAVSTTVHVNGQASTDGTANIEADDAVGTNSISVVALEVFSNDEEGLVCVRGVIPVDLVTSNAKGIFVRHDGSGALDDIETGDSADAIVLVPNTSGANVISLVMFDGLQGFHNT